ncbi:tape measure protein [Serratia liquefaciens]|uniref:tape measure protein n=1 Tax=Serratia liquefaciens TaxID=614 RepID=UPI002FEFBAAD
MSGGNVIITQTKNIVTFEADAASYAKAKKRIQQMGKEWDKVGDKMAKATNGTRPTGGGRFQGNGRRGGRGNGGTSQGGNGGGRPRQTPEEKAAKQAAAQAKKDAAAALRAEQRQMKQRQTMIDKMNARQARFGPVYNNTKGAMNYTQRAQARADFAKINQEYAKGAIGAQTYTAKLSMLQQQMKATAKQSRQVMAPAMVGGGLSPMAGALGAGLGAYGVMGAGRSLMNTGVDFQSIHSTILMTQKTEAEGKQMFEYLQNLSSTLGTDLVATSDSFAKMNLSRPKNLNLNDMQEVFTGFSEYGTALHLDRNKMGLAQYALQQMYGKQKVTAEELNRQMADAMPGAKQAFLSAWQNATGNKNMTQGQFDEDMSKGIITMDKISPHLGKAFGDMARKGGALDFAVKGINASFNRMVNSWKLFQNKIFESKFGDALTKAFDGASKSLNNLTDIAGGRLGELLGGFIEGFTDVAFYIHDSFVLADNIIEHYLKKWGLSGEQISAMWDWAGWTAGALIFGGSLFRIFKILTGLIKLVPGIKTLGSALSGAGLIGGAAGAAAAAKGGSTSTGGILTKATKAAGTVAGGAGAVAGGTSGVSKVMRFLGPVGELMMAYDLAKSQFGDQSENANAVREAGNRPKGFLDGAAQKAGMFDLSGRMYPTPALVNELKPNTPYMGHIEYMKQSASPTMDSFKAPSINVKLEQPKEVDVKVDVNVNDGKIQDLIEAAVNEQQGINFNLLTGGGE